MEGAGSKAGVGRGMEDKHQFTLVVTSTVSGVTRQYEREGRTPQDGKDEHLTSQGATLGAK